MVASLPTTSSLIDNWISSSRCFSFMYSSSFSAIISWMAEYICCRASTLSSSRRNLSDISSSRFFNSSMACSFFSKTLFINSRSSLMFVSPSSILILSFSRSISWLSYCFSRVFSSFSFSAISLRCNLTYSFNALIFSFKPAMFSLILLSFSLYSIRSFSNSIAISFMRRLLS